MPLSGCLTLPVSGRIGWFAGILDLNNVAPSIGLRPIKISEAVDLCELATRKRLTTPALNLRISSKVRDGTPDVPWRFGDDEMRLLRDGVTPICFADTIVIQHLLGTQPAGSQGNCGALMGLKLLRLRPAMRMTEVLARS